MRHTSIVPQVKAMKRSVGKQRNLTLRAAVGQQIQTFDLKRSMLTESLIAEMETSVKFLPGQDRKHIKFGNCSYLLKLYLYKGILSISYQNIALLKIYFCALHGSLCPCFSIQMFNCFTVYFRLFILLCFFYSSSCQFIYFSFYFGF